MITFYIDTTSSYLYTGLAKDRELIGERKVNLDHDLSTYALDEVAKLFSEAKIKPDDVDKIIVCNGPGSFTGIRIGVTIAKIMAYTKKIPITTISSLLSMKESVDTNYLKVPIINARRGYVFGAIYDDDQVILEEQYISLEKLKLILHGLNHKYVFISNDSFKDLDVVKYNPDILRVIKKYRDNKDINPHFVNPVYLKLTEAEENRLKG